MAAKIGGQVHAILACVKHVKGQGRTVRSKELLALWPKIGLSVLTKLLGQTRRYGAGDKLLKPADADLKRVAVGQYTITKAGEEKLRYLGPYTLQMWNPNATSGCLPWESAAVITTPKPVETDLVNQFKQAGYFPDLMQDQYHQGRYENVTTHCKNGACGSRRLSVQRYFQDPRGLTTGVLKATIYTCRLCKNQYLEGIEEVLVENVPEFLDFGDA